MHGTLTPRYLSRRPDARKPQHRSGQPKKNAVRELPARRFSTPGQRAPIDCRRTPPNRAYCCAAAARSFDTSFSLMRADLPERSRR